MATRTPISVLMAIRARIHGEFDNPHLMQMGILSTDTLADIGAWCAAAIKEADEWPAEKLKTNPESKAGWVDGPTRPATGGHGLRRGDRVWVSSDVDEWGRISCEGRIEEAYDDSALVRCGGQIRSGLLIPIGDCNALPLDVHSLREGDEVYWNDPDNGECSRYFTIRTIRIGEDGAIKIIATDGSELECFAWELA